MQGGWEGSLSSAVPLSVPAVLRALNFGRLSPLQGKRIFLVHPALLWFMAVPGMKAGQGAVVLRHQLDLPRGTTCSLGQQI